MSWKIARLSALLLYFFLLANNLGAQSPLRFDDLRFEHLTSDDGLSQNTIATIYQDRQGFLWIGTKDGLNRYDGEHFKIFTNAAFDSTSLADNSVNDVHEDQARRLWIATARGGLNYFDRAAEKFFRYQHDPHNRNSLSENHITKIFAENEHTLWVGTLRGGLNQLVLQATSIQQSVSNITRYQHDPNDLRSLNSNNVKAVFVDHERLLWVATDFGLNRLDLKTATTARPAFKHYTDILNDPKNPVDNAVWAIFADTNRRLWVQTSFGLSLYDRARDTFINFPYDPAHPFAKYEVGFGMCEGSSHQLWAAAQSVVAILDPQTGAYRFLKHDPANPHSLNHNALQSIYRDRSGVIWVGTSGKGLSKFAATTQRFQAFDKSTEKRYGYAGASVRTLYEDRRGTIWIGAYGGFYRLPRATMRSERFMQSYFGNAMIRAVHEDREGTLWFASVNGLTAYDPKRGGLTQYRHGPPNVGGNSNTNSITAILVTRGGEFWTAMPGALSRFDPASGRFEHHVYDSTFARNYHGDPAPACLREDHAGNLWVSSERGLVRFDRTHAAFRVYKNEPDDPASLNSNLVRAFLFDPQAPQKIMWVATAGGGLNRFDLTTETFSAITEKDGLPNNVVYSVLDDRDGNLWLSTNKGLAKLVLRRSADSLPALKQFRSYTIDDGLQSNEFNSGAFFKSASGEMFFGGINGFNKFLPEAIRDNPHAPPIALTAFQLFNRAVSHKTPASRLQKNIGYTEELTLAYRDNVFSFEFVALDFTAPERNQYAYKMENFDGDWVPAGTKRSVTYTNLNPGEYVFRAKGANSDGVWNEHGASIKITITPPWWKTWWAYMLYALFTGVLLYGLRRYELNRLGLKNQVRLEHMEAEKLKELDHLKSRFFANISHEFRTPLTLILGPLHDALAKISDGALAQQLQTAQRNGQRLLRLINQLLDLSKLDAGAMELKAGRANIIAFLKGIFFSFESLAAQKQLTLQFQSDYEDLEVYFEAEKLEQVFYNLISNALKFTPAEAHGKITVTVARSQISLLKKLPPNTECVQITIEDNGIGIAAERLPHVFDRFYQADNTHTREQEGTGIGLALAKEMVELHYGEIAARSEAELGTTFTVTLPLGRAHLGDARIEDRGLKIEARESRIEDRASGEVQQTTNKEQRTTDQELILLVEDNADMQAYIREHLSEDYHVQEAANGVEGVAQALAEIPDLIISDLMMPRMDGNALCKKLKTDERTSHIPIILLTAKASRESKIEGLETGADDYLTKPFDAQELRVRVRNLIAQRRQLRERYTRELILKPSEIAVTPLDEKFLHRVKAAVEKHLGEEEFSVEDLAREAGMSRVQLHRKLKALTNQAASDFILSMRLQRAADLLKQNAGTIAEIAYMTGFNTPNYFAKCFRKQFGCTPSEWRERQNT